MTTVLQVIPHLGAGGAEQACVDVTAGLTAAGHRALVVSAGGSRVPEIIRSGGHHIAAHVHSKNPLLMLWNALWLATVIVRHKVDIVHARSRAPAWSALWASRLTARPFVTTNHAAYKFSNPIKKFYNSVMAKGDRVIAISDFIAQQVASAYGVSRDIIRTIPRGIDLTRFDPMTIATTRTEPLHREWGVGLGQVIVLSPARLTPIKGQTTLIEAMALLPPELSHVQAVIVGDDQGRVGYRQQLQELIAVRGLQDRVKLVKHCADMPASYAMASLVVATSRVPEGFGRVPVEAMVMGVPVIATRLGGFTETISHGETGFLVDVDDPAALAQAMVDVLTMPREERSALIDKARRHARMRYDKWKMVADTLAVYDELYKKKP